MALRIWIDLETTHLDPAQGYILELAVVATEAEAPEYREVASQTWVIRPHGLGAFSWHDILQPDVYAMHNASGLLVEAGELGASTLAEAGAGLLSFLRYFGNPAPGREPIAGSSPHFDRAWLAHHMPAAARYFNSHRCFDTSSLKRLVLDCGHTWPGDPDAWRRAGHRALADIRHSIETARVAARLLKGTYSNES